MSDMQTKPSHNARRPIVVSFSVQRGNPEVVSLFIILFWHLNSPQKSVAVPYRASDSWCRNWGCFPWCRLRAAKEDLAVAVADDGVRVVLIDRLQLGPGLKDQAGADLTASDRGDQLLQIGNLADIRHLINQAAHMDGKSAPVDIIRFFTKQIEQLCIRHTDKEVEGAVRIGHDQEQRRLPVPEGIQLQFVVCSQLP